MGYSLKMQIEWKEDTIEKNLHILKERIEKALNGHDLQIEDYNGMVINANMIKECAVKIAEFKKTLEKNQEGYAFCGQCEKMVYTTKSKGDIQDCCFCSNQFKILTKLVEQKEVSA